MTPAPIAPVSWARRAAGPLVGIAQRGRGLGTAFDEGGKPGLQERRSLGHQSAQRAELAIALVLEDLPQLVLRLSPGLRPCFRRAGGARATGRRRGKPGRFEQAEMHVDIAHLAGLAAQRFQGLCDFVRTPVRNPGGRGAELHFQAPHGGAQAMHIFGAGARGNLFEQGQQPYAQHGWIPLTCVCSRHGETIRHSPRRGQMATRGVIDLKSTEYNS